MCDLNNIKGLKRWKSGIQIGRNHILINPTVKESETYIGTTLWFGEQRFHLFYTDIEAVDDVVNLLNKIQSYVKIYNKIHKKYSVMQPVRITIHMIKSMKDLIKVMKIRLNQFAEANFMKIKLSIESNGTLFKIPGPSRPTNSSTGTLEYNFHCDYYDYEILQYVTVTAVIPINNNISNYETNTIGSGNNHGPIDTLPKQLHPELFKDEIIKKFRESTPPAILAAFPTDKDIWDYIMMTGEWNVYEEDKK